MTFPIYPNTYNSLLPPPTQPEVSSVFSEGIRRVKLLRAAQLECVTLCLVWIDLALVTHQIALDLQLSGLNVSDGSNETSSWMPGLQSEFRNSHPALSSKASMALFIAITVMSFMFMLEGIARNVYSRVTQRRFHKINICDLSLCCVSFVLNLSLLVARISPLARDFVALLIVFRLTRMLTLTRGLTHQEKCQIIHMLDGYRREESFNSEHQRMLQTELENRTKECQDLRELVKSATLSRNRLKQKQQLQMQQEKSASPTTSTANGDVLELGSSQHQQEDSGHSSDSSPSADTPPLEVFGRATSDSGGAGTPSDIELTSIPCGSDSPDHGSNTSKM